MADEKKPEKSSDKPAETKDAFVEVVSLIATILIIVYIINGIASFFNSSKLFSSGIGGLTPRSVLLSHTRPISSLDNPINSKIVSVNETDVHGSPGGKKVGRQRMNSRGKILQGPVEVDDVRYWYVDYETGQDGWVRESDIAYLESEPNFLERTVINSFQWLRYTKIFLIVFCILCIIFIAYMIKELTSLRREEARLLYPEPTSGSSDVNPQWERILAHIDSLNENDWRLAILEADIMLDSLLEKLSLPGETISERLKAVEKSDFVTVDNAWEAHKIRNQVAHEGQSFVLTQREAKRVIELYATVFKEFQLI